MDDLELERERKKRKTILSNWDEIAEKLQCGESIDLNAFVPDDNRRKRINTDIVKTLENKKKL